MTCNECEGRRLFQAHILPPENNSIFSPKQVSFPQELSEEAIKAIALRSLPEDYYCREGAERVQVEYFSKGSFHQLYKVFRAKHNKWYIFRVPFPVNARLKTENEVATLKFLSEYTTIPVPRVIAWDSSCENELRTPWVMLEAVDGVDLREMWRDLSFENKVGITESITEMEYQLCQISFDRIGGLYLCNKLCPNCGPELPKAEPILTTTQQDLIAGETPEEKSTYYYGPCFTAVEPIEEKLKLELHGLNERGPYSDDIEWLKAILSWQNDLINSRKKAAENGDKDTMDDYDIDSDYVDDDYEVETRRLEICKELLLSIFDSTHNKHAPKYYMFNSDTLKGNIIIDPKNPFKIAGLIDWEMTFVAPAWIYSLDYPCFLNESQDRTYEKVVPKGDPDLVAEVQERLDARELRNVYDKMYKRRAQIKSDQPRFESEHRIKYNLLSYIESVTQPFSGGYGNEMLRDACVDGNETLVRKLIDINPEWARITPYSLTSLVDLARKHGHEKILGYLIEQEKKKVIKCGI